MKSRFMFIGRLWTVQVLALVLSLFGGSAHASCSPDLGTVVLNEIQIPANRDAILELRLLDPYIVDATSNFTNWGIDVYRSGHSMRTITLKDELLAENKNICGTNSGSCIDGGD